MHYRALETLDQREMASAYKGVVSVRVRAEGTGERHHTAPGLLHDGSEAQQLHWDGDVCFYGPLLLLVVTLDGSVTTSLSLPASR